MRRLKKEYREKSGLELAKLCVLAAEDSKAQDLVVLDVRGISSFTDYFVIMSGRSTKHVQSLAESIEDKLRAKRAGHQHCEGLREGQWVLLDFSDVVVHIFYQDIRSFYNLEGLWHDARPVSAEELAEVEIGEPEIADKQDE